MLVFHPNLSLMEHQIFGLISSFLSNGWLRVVLHGKSSQQYPVNTGVPQGSSYDDVICNIAIYADDATLL